MWPLLPAQTSLVASCALVVVGATTVRLLLPDVARTTATRAVGLSFFAIVIALHAMWTYGLWCYWGATIASIIVCLLPFAIASVPVAALFRKMAAHACGAKPPNLGRRAFVGAATLAAPAMAIGGGASGFMSADRPPEIPRVRFEWDQLPVDLDGTCILHLSDLHLGVDRHVEDLEALFEKLRGQSVDLVVFTGDVAEDVRQLAPALDAAVRFAPRLGVYTSLGNHEYLTGIDAALRVHAQRSDTRLLRGEGAMVRSGRAQIWIAGADDPVFVDRDPIPFLEKSIERSIKDAPVDAFKLLLSHRPEGFVPAARGRIDLVLAGHTHGGQIGFNGKSAFEPIWRDHYLWGSYEKGRSRLYTTSGFGHWFPYRLMCPTEAPLIELVRKPRNYARS